ncbi:MAG TPA: EAL domain-containing protein [Thiopseudomonas sp.]|nr:EAL domain-containing protein [Thiopseudomonas sp.]
MKTTISPNSLSGKALALGELSSAIFEAAVDSMIVIDEYGIIHALNPAAERTFGYSSTDIIGQNVSTLMPEKEAKQHDGYLQAYAKTGERKMIGKGREVTGKRKDGSYFPMHLSIGELSVGDQKLYVGICHDISSNKRLLKKITYMATHDSLTGCLNRNYLHSSLQELMSVCTKNNLQLVVLFIDLDGFKQINDNYDHDVGDQLLSSVAQRIQSLLGPEDILARIGGDEFLVASNQTRQEGAPRQLAQRILDILEPHFNIDGIDIRIRASIGVSLYPGHTQSSDQLVNDADIAMYKAKLAGGHCMRFFEIAQREQMETTFKTVSRLRKAIELEQFELHYQLQFNLAPPYQPIGIEGLLRWHDGDNGLVLPDNFLPLAEEYGLMPSITLWALKQACLDNQSIMTEQLLQVPVAINCCGPSFLQSDFVSLVHSILADTKLPAQYLEIEITESVALHNLPLAQETILKLKQSGIKVAMDDFGTGFSSPGILKHLSVNRLKIDRSFVNGLPHSDFDVAVIKSILIVAQSIDMQVIAEGIENIEQLQYLEKLGCHQGQGYWYAKPLPLNELKAVLQGLQAQS